MTGGMSAYYKINVVYHSITAVYPTCVDLWDFLIYIVCVHERSWRGKK